MTAEDFKEGRASVVVTTLEDFRKFCQWASEWGITWRNGIDPIAEELSMDGPNYVNDCGVIRYHDDVNSVYRATAIGDITLRRRVNHSYRVCSVTDLVYKHEIRDDGFEEEL